MIGIDIVEIPRVKKIIQKYNQKFCSRFFTKKEQTYCNSTSSKDLQA
ncbi:4'-phosphopantetheinyl transferase superfamily protein, partial [Candidatus Margulisiibacteriota bacterium]